jgi:hypothetical protein
MVPDGVIAVFCHAFVKVVLSGINHKDIANYCLTKTHGDRGDEVLWNCFSLSLV